MQIIKDTREQTPWAFGELETVTRKLDSGDYTLQGFEKTLCIERKKSVAEIALNVGSDRIRFNKELERMKEFEHAYLICEFSINDIMKYPVGSDIPMAMRKHVRMSGKYIFKILSSYEELYGIEVIYAGSRWNAIEEAVRIFKSLTELDNNYGA